MSTETPRNGDGAKLCAWCGSEIRQAGVGRSRDYCRRSCRQRAYEARKQREAVVAAVATAIARRDSSRVERPRPIDPSRDETEPAGRSPIPAEPAAVLPTAWRAEPPPPRRMLSRRRAGMTGSAMPLPGLGGDEPEPETP